MNTNSITEQPAGVFPATWLALAPFLLVLALLVAAVFVLPIMQKRVLGLDPTFVKMVAGTCLAAFIFSQAWFSQMDSFKYVNPYALYWLKYGFGIAAAMLLTLDKFLSKDYAEHEQKAKDAASHKVTETETDIHSKSVLRDPPQQLPDTTAQPKDKP